MPSPRERLEETPLVLRGETGKPEDRCAECRHERRMHDEAGSSTCLGGVHMHDGREPVPPCMCLTFVEQPS